MMPMPGEALRVELAGKIWQQTIAAPGEADWRAQHVREDAGQVLGEAVGRFVAEIEAAQRDLIGKRLALRWLIQEGLAGDCAAWALMCSDHLPDAEGRDEHRESYYHYVVDADAAIAPWRDALAALMVDASAALPA